MRIAPRLGQAFPRPTRAAWPAWVLLGALALLAILLTLRAWTSVQTMAGFFTWPLQFDESESMIVAETLLLDRGVDIYAPLTAHQFIAAPYPPLYYLLNWPFIHFLGATFKPGRALTLLATAAAALLIYALAVRLTRDRLAGLLGALAWGGIGIVEFWGVLVKPDMLALACGLGGIWWLLRAPPAATARLWGALPFFWAAFYSKQTAFGAAAAACAWLILRDWRRGVPFAAVYAAGAAGGSLALNVVTGGGYFYHEGTVHDLPWMADRFLGWMADWLGTYWPLVGLGALGAAALLAADLAGLLRAAGGPAALLRCLGRFATLDVPQGGILVAGYLAASVATAAASGTLGGNHNHLLDLTAACCLGFALGVARLRASARPAVQLAGALVVLAVCTQVPALYDTPHWLGHELRRPSADVAQGWRNVLQYTSNTPGPVYSTDLSVLLATNKWKLELWTTDPYTQTHATHYGRWDQAALLQAVRAGHFALVVLTFSLEDANRTAAGALSPELVSALRQAYHLDQRNVAYLYKPNRAP